MSKAETGKVYTSREAAELGGEILEVEEKPGVFRQVMIWVGLGLQWVKCGMNSMW